MTILQACDRYDEEIGQYHKRSDQTAWSLKYIVNFFGADTPIAAIGNNEVARLVAKRRGETVENVMRNRALARAGDDPKRLRKIKTEPKRLSPARVNRSVTEPLRKILRRAADIWGEQVQRIAWSEHMLKEPQERVRELKADEEARLFAVLPQKYHAIVRFTLRAGCRVSECVGLTWQDIDWGNRQILLHGKGDTLLPIPLTGDLRALLWPLRAADAKHVFAHEDDRHGDARPFTYWAVDSAMDRAKAKADIKDFRYHDLRHTAATRLLRQKGNLRLVQQLLRHKDIATTARYAHVMQDDLRDAMEAVAAAESPTANPSIPATESETARKTKA